MSQFSEIMEELAAIREQNAWLVSAVKKLLLVEAGISDAPTSDPVYGLELDLFEEDDQDVPVPVHAPRPKNKPCPHNDQRLVNGQVVCGRCGQPLVQGGVLNDPSRHGNLAARTEWGQNSLRESEPLPG